MKPEISREDLKNASREYRRRIAQIGFSHLGAVDARTASILRRNRILKRPNSTDETEAQAIAEMLGDISHAKRVPLPNGPLVAQATDESHRTVIPVVVLLFAESLEVRRAALAHFEARQLNSDPWLTPRTLLVLTSQREALLCLGIDNWQPAATQIHDAIKSDWLCNLRGLAQSADLRFDDGVKEYCLAVLRPTISSLDSIEMAVWSPGTCESQIDAIITDSVNACNLGEAMQSYYSKLGHLPLSGFLGMGEVVRRWLRAKGGADHAWDEIWKWADDLPSPLPRYHASSALMQNPSALTQQLWPTLGGEIANIACASPPGEQEAELPWAEAWRLRRELALHYCRHLEVRVPGAEGERIAALAWWLSEKLALVIGASDDNIRHFREGTLRHELNVSERIWHLARTRLASSSLNCATVAARSVWGLSLLCELRHVLTVFRPDRWDQLAKTHVEEALKERLVTTFPIKPVEDNSIAYAFDATVIPTLKAWIEVADEGESRDILAAFLTPIERVAQADEVVGAIDRFPALVSADQSFVAHVLGMLARLGQAPEDRLWERINDEQWREAVLLNVEELPLELMFNALREIQLLREDKWAWNLPHLYASACERALSPERRALLFAMTVLSCLDGGTVSAVDRLLKGNLRHQLEPQIKEWRERFEEIWAFASPLVTARFRPMMAALSAVAVPDVQILSMQVYSVVGESPTRVSLDLEKSGQ